MKEKLKRLFTTESLIVAAVIFIAIFFAKFPTLYNWLNTPKGYWFPKQTSWFDAWDINFQVSYIRFGQRRGVLLENTYTTALHKPVFIYQYYTILGVVNRFLHLDPFLLFHLSSVITSVILILVCWYIVRLFFQESVFRIASFAVLVLGGGAGWLPVFGISADTNLAGFTMLYAFERGHEALITLLLLLSFAFIFQYLTSQKKKYIYWLLIASFLAISIHPPFAALLFLVGILAGFWQLKRAGRFTLFIYPILLVVIFAIYYLAVLSKLVGNPGFSGVVGQSLFSVDSLFLATGFGIISIFLFWMLLFSKEGKVAVTYLRLLFITQLFLLLSPLGFHLYFAKNLYTWGAILGFYGIKEFIKKKKRQIQVIIFLVAFSLITRIYIFDQLLHVNRNNPFFFLTKQEGEAINFMSKLPADSGVLSLYRIGNYIPAFSDLRVYYGHNFQTPNSKEKRELAQKFYLQQNEKTQLEFANTNNIHYVYYGLEEANLRKNANLATANPFPRYPVIYQNEKVTIYTLPTDQK